jgi:mono/diheme cytochrome c family protein
MLRICALSCLTAVASCCFLPASAATEIDYTRDVQPILSEHCIACHGVDAEARRSGLRLDLESGALRGGDSGEPAVVPGNSTHGTLLQRITSTNSDEVMPPPDHGHPLSETQIETLRKWIDQGAPFASHWAFVPPIRPKVDLSLAEHPIDALIAAKLAEQQISMAPPAAGPILCRRLYLDLIGLPPTLDELDAYERDGFDTTVRQLLASPRYGEKWARHWLDAARYSDTNGYEKDLKREQWIWRDWVIDAFNSDMPYDEFIRQQIAGDLLPNATQSQWLATGFLRNSMLNEEGAIIPEQFRMVEMFDRIDCMGRSIMGLTTGCAQCHTHKFDPLSQTEYFGLFAFLNDTYEAQSWVYSDEQLQQREAVSADLQQVDERVRQSRPDWKNELQQFTQQIVDSQVAWQPLTFHQLESISGLNHPVQLDDRSILMLGHTSGDVFYVGKGQLQGATGLRLEALTHRDLPFSGPGRNRVGGWELKELEVWLKRPGNDAWEQQKLVNATADYSMPEIKDKDGKKASGPVSYLIDGQDENSWKADRGVGRRNQPSVAVLQFGQPLECPPETEIKVVMRMGDMLGCCRLSLTRAVEPQASNVAYQAVQAAQIPVEQRTSDQQQALFTAWQQSVAELKTYQDEAETIWKKFPEAQTSVMHLAQRPPEQHRATHVLLRGEWDQALEEVQPHVPAAFHPLDPAWGNGRLALAHWLVDRRSPLAARVAVNRIWQALFGEGLVETSEDFGTRAAVPEHLPVLDWLAVDFMEHGWSHKHLLTTITRSQAYQRSSQQTDEQRQRDPNNRWLARGPRFRADAEVVRDMALALSGLISHRLGGPGVIPPVPENVINYNYVVPTYWTPATGPDRYRRTVYGFRKRSMPDPVMSNFDGPTGDFACVRRLRSNTPLAALTGLNETIFVESARAFALRILREAPPSDQERIRYAFRLCTARQPQDSEVAVVLELLADQRARIAEGWLNPRAIATGNPQQLPDLPDQCTPQDAAAWTLVARVLLNLDETINKN